MNKRSPSFFSLSLRPWELLTATGVMICLATVFSFLGRFFWFFELFSHFRVQYLVGLSILSLLLLVRRCKTAAVFLAFAGLNLFFILPMYFSAQNITPGAGDSLRVMLLNVNKERGDAARVMQVVREVDPDILVLLEISSRWLTDLTQLRRSHPYTLTLPREDNFGIGLFSKFQLFQSKIIFIGSAKLPSLLATVTTEQKKLRILATHPMPPAGTELSMWRNEQLDLLPDYTRSSLPLILLGDLNVTPWSYFFQRLLKRSLLLDSTKGFGIQPTWPNWNLFFRIPLDHCLHSSDIVVRSRKIGPDAGSDHLPLIVDLLISKKKG